MIVFPVAILFTSLGIYSFRRKEPMWFWSGKAVDRDEISDIPSYNRANGKMWIGFSLIFWLSALLSILNIGAAGAVMGAGMILGIPLLVVIYGRIYAKYRNY